MIQREFREPPAEVITEQQTLREEQAPRQSRQPVEEIMEEVEMDQVPDIQMEEEQPAPKVTAPAKPPAKPRGTAMMDAPGWSNVDPENIVTGGRRTRRSAGSAMHAKGTAQTKTEQAMGFHHIWQSLMENALMAVSNRTKEDKDDEEDIQISISADSDDRKPAPTSEIPGIKEDQFNDFVIT